MGINRYLSLGRRWLIAMLIARVSEFWGHDPEFWRIPVMSPEFQHYDHEMSQSFFDELAIPTPAYHLGAGSGSHAVQTAKIMVAFEEICEKEKDEKNDGAVSDQIFREYQTVAAPVGRQGSGEDLGGGSGASFDELRISRQDER